MPRHYFDISLAMSQFNRQISYLLDKHSNDPPVLIQELFNLLPLQSSEEKKMTQTAILYSMETIHEWQNISYYIEKWQLYSFRKELIKRMRRRLDEDPSEAVVDSKEELQRLVEKYWLNHSPKKEENKYKEPIDIRLRAKKVDTTSIPVPSEKPQEKVHPIMDNKSTYQRIQENTQASNRGTMGQTDMYSTLTGRPAILKKASIFEQTNKTQELEANQVKSKGMEENKATIEPVKHQQPMQIQTRAKPQKPLSKIQINEKHHNNDEKKNVYKMLTQFCQTASRDRNTINQIPKKSELPQTAEYLQHNKNQINQKANEPYPSEDQFYFGSTKKPKEPELKKLTISPNKRLSVSNKIIKIRRTQPEPLPTQQLYGKEEDFHNDFSFMKDNFQTIKSQPESSKEHNVQDYLNFKAAEVIQEPQPQKNSINVPGINPFQLQTPVFLDKSRLGGQVEFLSKQELKVVEDVNPKYYVRNFLKERGITWMKVFSEKLSKFADF